MPGFTGKTHRITVCRKRYDTISPHCDNKPEAQQAVRFFYIRPDDFLAAFPV